MTWLAGAERITSYKGDGGTYVDAPWRLVVHTTEVIPTDVNGARGMASRHPNPPHFWAWPDADWLGQTVQLEHSAFALAHPPGTPETNKMHALQVEVVGWAKDTETWPASRWKWLGERLVAPLIQAGIPLNLDRVAPTCGPEGSGLAGAVRMTREAWAAFDGICGHANVPDNDHWDPGHADLGAIAAAAKAVLAPPATQPNSDTPTNPSIGDPMSIFKDEADEREYHVRKLYADECGREPSVGELDAGIFAIGVNGFSPVYTKVRDSDEAVAHRAGK